MLKIVKLLIHVCAVLLLTVTSLNCSSNSNDAQNTSKSAFAKNHAQTQQRGPSSSEKNDVELSPRFQKIARAYSALRTYAEKTQSPFGENFVSYQPTTNTYAEGFFSFRDIPELDLINRKFMALSRYAPSLDDPLVELYDRSDTWKPDTNRRASGILFMGFKQSPKDIQKDSGIWSNLFKRAKDSDKRVFQQLARQGEQISPSAFNLESHVRQTKHSAFVSLTRSVHVARHFAIFTGYEGNMVDEGYVLAILAHHAFDTHDQKNIDAAFLYPEQELSLSGVVPWGHIVGYRKIARTPSHDAPPEFVGPIYLREQFVSMEPQLAAQVTTYLSTKSKHTEAHEQFLADPKNNKPWQEIWERLNRDGTHRNGFHWDHDYGL